MLLPGIARKKYDALLGKPDAMLMASNTSQFNKSEYTDSTDKAAKTGIVACGIGYNYVKEAIAQLPAEKQALYNIEKVSQYPLPEQRIQMLAKESGKLLVVEDGQPVVEESVKGILGTGYIVTGRHRRYCHRRRTSPADRRSCARDADTAMCTPHLTRWLRSTPTTVSSATLAATRSARCHRSRHYQAVWTWVRQ